MNSKLKLWNSGVFGILDLGIEEAVKFLNKLDQLVANGDISFSFDTTKKISQAMSLVWKKLHYRESIIRQKSKCRWNKEDNQNSKLSNSFMKSRFRRNRTVALILGGILI